MNFAAFGKTAGTGTDLAFEGARILKTRLEDVAESVNP